MGNESVVRLDKRVIVLELRDPWNNLEDLGL